MSGVEVIFVPRPLIGVCFHGNSLEVLGLSFKGVWSPRVLTLFGEFLLSGHGTIIRMTGVSVDVLSFVGVGDTNPEVGMTRCQDGGRDRHTPSSSSVRVSARVTIPGCWCLSLRLALVEILGRDRGELVSESPSNKLWTVPFQKMTILVGHF